MRIILRLCLTYVDLIVMQRSCSSLRVSVKRVSPAFAPAMIPAFETSESVKVDLPWSTWAMTDILRMFRFLSIMPRISSTVKFTYEREKIKKFHLWKNILIWVFLKSRIENSKKKMHFLFRNFLCVIYQCIWIQVIDAHNTIQFIKCTCSCFLEFQCHCFDCNIVLILSFDFFSFLSADKWNKFHVFFVSFRMDQWVVRFVYVISSVPSFLFFFVFIFSWMKLTFYIFFHINIMLIELNNVDAPI